MGQSSSLDGTPEPTSEATDDKPPTAKAAIAPEVDNQVPQPSKPSNTEIDERDASPADGLKPMRSPAPAPLDCDGSSGEDEETLPVVELGEDGLPSVGSSAHASGDCRRCCFFPKGRCTNGHDCTFCHFGHDKRTRMKKKKKSASERSTPLSAQANAAGALLASQLSPNSSLWSAAYMTTPTGQGIPPTPMSPSMPPPAPPSLGGIQSAETPPPPSDAPQLPTVEIKQLAEATSSAAALQEAATADVVASVPPPSAPTSPSGGAPLAMVTATPTGMSGKSMTLTDLIQTATGVPRSPAMALPPSEQQNIPLWPPAEGLAGAPGSHYATGMPGGWPLGYDVAAQAMWPYYGGMPTGHHFYPGSATDASTRIPELHSDALGLPPIVPSVSPNALDQESIQRDSPRSVILTLGGAWGALSTGSPEKKPGSSLDSAVFSRSQMLGYRIATSGSRKPGSLKSLKVAGAGRS